jgi:hypothetical protein
MISIGAWAMCANLDDRCANKKHGVDRLLAERSLTDEKRLPALCLALVDPLPTDMAAVAEWYMTQVQRLDSIVESEKTLESRSGIVHEFHN